MTGMMPTMYGKPYVALFPLRSTDGESRMAVNNKTAHCIVNSVIRGLFHLPCSAPPQR